MRQSDVPVSAITSRGPRLLYRLVQGDTRSQTTLEKTMTKSKKILMAATAAALLAAGSLATSGEASARASVGMGRGSIVTHGRGEIVPLTDRGPHRIAFRDHRHFRRGFFRYGYGLAGYEGCWILTSLGWINVCGGAY
jgi:hypothetical protein